MSDEGYVHKHEIFAVCGQSVLYSKLDSHKLYHQKSTSRVHCTVRSTRPRKNNGEVKGDRSYNGTFPWNLVFSSAITVVVAELMACTVVYFRVMPCTSV